MHNRLGNIIKVKTNPFLWYEGTREQLNLVIFDKILMNNHISVGALKETFSLIWLFIG